MAFGLPDVLRHFFGGDKKEKPAFKTEREAYDFCRETYNKTGGVPDELRRTYEFYVKNFNDECEADRGPFQARNKRNSF
jgi:hypothetical protein